MTPEEALRSEVFQFYAMLAGGVLVVAGCVLALLRWVAKKDIRSVWLTYRGWLFIVPFYFAVLLAGRIVFIAAVTLISILGFKEFAKATGLYRDWWMTALCHLAILSVGVIAFVPDPNHGDDGWYGLFMTAPVFFVAAIVLVPIIRDRPAGQIQNVSLAILGVVYIGWMFGHLAFLANCEHAYGYLLYLVFAVALNDVAAFLFGKTFGKHKLRPHTSPNKTWEGALGALAISMALPWALAFTMPHFGARELLLAGLIVGIGGQLGDLTLGFIKRDLGIKDMGAILPGHGGVLDRINSLIYSAPLFLHMVDYCHKHW
ncbi:MAG: phosphatidate cytidylyltransferase [Planctomycetes bacterium]|nr:phosphatidate cytidylyltransferase [Planctomycetota bacterium]